MTFNLYVYIILAKFYCTVCKSSSGKFWRLIWRVKEKVESSKFSKLDKKLPVLTWRRLCMMQWMLISCEIDHVCKCVCVCVGLLDIMKNVWFFIKAFFVSSSLRNLFIKCCIVHSAHWLNWDKTDYEKKGFVATLKRLTIPDQGFHCKPNFSWIC